MPGLLTILSTCGYDNFSAYETVTMIGPSPAISYRQYLPILQSNQSFVKTKSIKPAEIDFRLWFTSRNVCLETIWLAQENRCTARRSRLKHDKLTFLHHSNLFLLNL